MQTNRIFAKTSYKLAGGRKPTGLLKLISPNLYCTNKNAKHLSLNYFFTYSLYAIYSLKILISINLVGYPKF